MSAITIPLPARQSKPWTPSDRDRLIFRWVKLEGMTQFWVAQQFGIHQATVSRVLARYARWVARGGPSQEGALSHEERVRYQRWITYERNEIIIDSCLRLADEMTRPLDTSKSTTQYASHHPSGETHVRTQHLCLDRSTTAGRYLRLAHRVNMDQLNLVEKDDLAPLERLTQADLDPTLDDELNRADSQIKCPSEDVAASIVEEPPRAEESPSPSTTTPPVEPSPDRSTSPVVEESFDPSTSPAPAAEAQSSSAPMHKTHNASPAPSAPTSNTSDVYVHSPCQNIFAPHAYSAPDTPLQPAHNQTAP